MRGSPQREERIRTIFRESHHAVVWLQFFMLTKWYVVLRIYNINLFFPQVLIVRAPPPPSFLKIILSLLVIMYISVNSMYCKKGAFFRTGLKNDKCMQVWGCKEWG